MIIAYLRVSTSKQELNNQRFEIECFAQKKDLLIDRWEEEIISGTMNEDIRILGRILNELKEGDKLIVSEVSRLSRTLEDVMGIMGKCLKKKAEIHCVKEDIIFSGGDISSKILAFAFGMTAEIERRLISVRTKEALARKRAEGMILGRPLGSGKQSKRLEEKREQIIELLRDKISKVEIANKFGVSRPTLYRFLRDGQI